MKQNKVHIHPYGSKILGPIPAEFMSLVDLYNTWACFFRHELRCQVSHRYVGFRGGIVKQDTEALGDAIVSRINNGNPPSIAMARFMKKIRNSRKYSSHYRNSKCWFERQSHEFPAPIEHSMFKMCELFKVNSFCKHMESEGLRINFYQH